MSGFRKDQLEIKGESDVGGGAHQPRVVKYEAAVTRKVTPFEFNRISSSGAAPLQPQSPRRAGAGAPGAAAAENDAFNLNPLIRSGSRQEEERRLIEQEVSQRVEALSQQVRAQAAEQGYRDGLAKGHEEAYLEAKQELGEKVRRLEELLQSFESAKISVFAANERFLMELVFRIGKLVLLRELKTDSDFVLRLAREVVEHLGARDQIRLKLNPEDIALGESVRQGLQQTLGTLRNFAIDASAEVALGGCAVETEWGSVDASVETRLQAIYDALVAGGSSGVLGAGVSADVPQAGSSSGEDDS